MSCKKLSRECINRLRTLGSVSIEYASWGVHQWNTLPGECINNDHPWDSIGHYHPKDSDDPENTLRIGVAVLNLIPPFLEESL